MSEDRQERFAAYVEALAEVIGHADRAEPLRDYCLGLLLPGERKSVEPIAAVTAPARVSAKHQSLLHFVANAPWSNERVLSRIQELILPIIEGSGAIEAWIIDDTGFPKKGRHSVGVARQYCGQLGKRDNCQVAVSLSLANHAASLPIAWRLYLPQDWAADKKRRTVAGVPEDIVFATKPAIALGQIRQALADHVPVGIVLGDAGYGVETDFRVSLRGLGLSYALGVKSSTGVWAPGTAPLPPLPYSGRGRQPTRLRRNEEHKPVSTLQLARSLPASAWRRVSWREGSRGDLASRFAALRVRPAHGDTQRSEPWPEEWLLIEWPRGEAEPTRYWLSNLGPTTRLAKLVRTAKARWLIERDYEELKQEIGLDHYEGRGWRGFHHHASLCIAAYGFLVAERCLFPPRRRFIRERIETPVLPRGFRPRGAAHPA